MIQKGALCVQATIGFIGTGVMGQRMVLQLLKAGYHVHVYNRTKAKTDDLIAQGAVWQDTVADIARETDIVITMVGFPSDVEAVYFGTDGILQNARQGTHLIDMTTSKPLLAEHIAEEGRARHLHVWDAPVSGGDIGAKNGTLTIMVGGETEAFADIEPVLDVLGDNIVHQGEAGSGQHTKMANQITIASNMMGVSEAVAYAKKAGLNPNRVLESISYGAAGSWSLSNLAPRMIQGDDAPGFYVKHFIKDMSIAIEAADEMALPVPGLKQAKALYDQLAEQGHENAGTQALYQWYAYS